MALIATTGSLIRQYNAFTGLSALERSQSGIARAEVVYYNVNDSWGAPGAGNNRYYQTGQISLPKDFGYVLTDAFVEVASPGQVVVETEAAASLTIYPGGVLGPQIKTTLHSDASRQTSNAATQIGSIEARRYNSIYPDGGDKATITYLLTDKPTALIYPFGSQAYTTTPNPASLWEFQIGEDHQNGSAYQITAYFRFLQYDIDQSYNYVLQSPQLTR